jgi:hypothetical protein
MTEEVRAEVLVRLAAIGMEDKLNRLVNIGQATRDEQGRYTLNIAADNRDIIRRLLGLPG